MVVRIRLQRHGVRNAPFYHIVAIADHKPVKARPIEKLGEYDPVPRPKKFIVPKVDVDAPVLSSGLPQQAQSQKPEMEKRLEWDTDRIKWWLDTGAQPSKTMAKMLDKAGLIPAGVFFKGMYRPPTEEGLAHLEALRKMPSTAVKQKVAELQESLVGANRKAAKQKRRAKADARAARLGQQVVRPNYKKKTLTTDPILTTKVTDDMRIKLTKEYSKEHREEYTKAHKAHKALLKAKRTAEIQNAQKTPKASKSRKTNKSSLSRRKSSPSTKANIAKPSPSSPPPSPPGPAPVARTQSAAQTPS